MMTVLILSFSSINSIYYEPLNAALNSLKWGISGENNWENHCEVKYIEKYIGWKLIEKNVLLLI